MNSHVNLIIEGKKATLLIDKPDTLNALNSSILQEIEIHCNELKKNTQVHIVIIATSGEKAFVAGADIKEMSSLNPVEGQIFSKQGQNIFTALEHLPQIVIARVQGFALGGGLELALACDFIISSEKARFAFPEVSLGLIPGFGGHLRLLQRIGYAKAIELISTGEKITSEDAKALGLINHVVPEKDLDSFILKICDSILKNAPHAIRSAKATLKQSTSSTAQSSYELENAMFGLRFSTDEFKEGVNAFQERRTPKFG